MKEEIEANSSKQTEYGQNEVNNLNVFILFNLDQHKNRSVPNVPRNGSLCLLKIFWL